MTSISGSGVCIQFPLPDQRLIRNQATEDTLLLLRNPHASFTVTERRTITGHGGATIDTALGVLDAAALIHARKDGRKKLISANRDRFQNPDDPLLSSPQDAFRDPVNVFPEKTEQVAADVVGVILFGSVARGTADRASDIDLQVIVDSDLSLARRELHDIRQDLEAKPFDGERFEFQLLVKSVESAESYGEELRENFSEGITLKRTKQLEAVQEAVFSG